MDASRQWTSSSTSKRRVLTQHEEAAKVITDAMTLHPQVKQAQCGMQAP